MKKMTKWLAVCAVCVMGSVPAMAAEVPDVTVTPIPIETPAPDVTPIETPAPTPIPEAKNGMSMEQKIRNILKMDSILQECVKSMVEFIISVPKDL